MTGKQYNTETILAYSWELAVSGFWLRYPNSFSRHVLTEDVLDRFIDDKGRLHTRRLFKKTNSLPKWVLAIVPSSPKDMWVVEDSVCDCHNKTCVVKTVNVGYFNIMKCTETAFLCHDTPCSSIWKRHCHAVSRIYGAATALQMFAVERYKRNATNALKGYQMVLQQLYGNTTSISSHSEISKKLRKLEKLRQSARKAGEMAVDRGEEFVHSGLGAVKK